ncbi:MAG TPA: TetR/AcrR family transcriptional regulator [Longimicrobiaceae bacterium]|nr:TetR/AcrR family transcriptional regulator [Longimicrobiaceae bacterium]
MSDAETGAAPVSDAVARSPGRPRSEAAHEAIVSAALALTRAVGYDAVTMEGIAATAGVGKATVYRRWNSKDEVIAEALQRLLRHVPVPDTGTLRGDLLAEQRVLVGMYGNPATRTLLSGLVAAMARSHLISEAVRGGFAGDRIHAIRTVLQRGIARGEVRADVDVETAIDVVAGPLMFRYLMRGEPVDEALGERVVDLALSGLVPRT